MMHLLRLVMGFVAILAVVSSGIPASAKEITAANSVKDQDATLSGNEAARELTADLEGDEERAGRRGGGGRRGGRGGGGRRGTGGGYYGMNTHLGFMNTNSISERNKECIRFVNWVKRRFNKDIKECPKKTDMDEYVRHLRA